jgi:hypothetical protein
LEGYNFDPDGTTPSFSNLDEINTMSVLEAAIDYQGRGLTVTPLLGKRPVLRSWQKRHLSESEVPCYFVDGRNVGIVLGGSTGIIDVDLDNPVAVAVADLLLPDTLESGRARNPRSHRWYVCEPVPASRRFSLTESMARRLKIEPGEEPLAELRSTGHQTVVAPSIHPVGGDRYLWHSGEICEIGGEVLAELVLDVAIAALLALNRPLGSRTSFAIYAAGYLSPRVRDERAQRIVEAASSAFDDEEHDERMLAVRASLQKPIGADPTIDVAMAAELERLAQGVPSAISRWYERGRRHRGGAR